MLPLVLGAAAAVAAGKGEKLYRHAVAATANLNLPDWETDDGGQAGDGCKTALALLQLYFTDQIGPPPRLKYTSDQICGLDTAGGCFTKTGPSYAEGGQIEIKTERAGPTRVEVEHYICLHELLHWQGFGATLTGETESYNYNAIAKELWQTEHPGGTSIPIIDDSQHWKIDDTNAETNFGTHESETAAIRELMTPGIATTNDNTQVETYLSAATLLACAWPSYYERRKWCAEGYPCDADDTCFHPTEQHGTGTDIEADILPGYCSHAVQHTPGTGGGGGGGGGTGDDGGGDGGNGLSGGAIAGIVVGAVVVIGGAVAVAAGSGLLSVPALVGSEAEVLLL